MPDPVPAQTERGRAQDTCPTCGAVVVVYTAGEGTSHMVAASSTDLLRAQMERDEARQQLGGTVSEIDRLKGLLTLWGNFAPPEVRSIVPGPNGKSLEELTYDAFGGR